MRLLYLTHRMPYPPNKGDKIRSFHILNHLAQRHEVTLVCLVDDPADLHQVPELERRVKKVLFRKIRPMLKKLCATRELIRSHPISVGYFYSSELQRQVDEHIDHEAIDACVCSSSPMAEYLYRSRHAYGKLRDMLHVMDLIDVDSSKWREYAQRSRWPMSWIYRYEAVHLADYERRIAATFDHVLLVSQQEKAAFPEGVDTTRVEAMPNGVDLDYFTPEAAYRRIDTRPRLVFTGAMDYFANVDGIRWFVESVFPHVRRALPEVELYIVGSRPTPEVRGLARTPGVTVTGFVDDVREYLATADVGVVPLRIARGIQNKVLEAMAMGKAVVCTPQALEGIEAVPGREIVVADRAESFAAEIIGLVQDRTRARDIGRAARRRVESNYDWNKNLAILDRILAPAAVGAVRHTPGTIGLAPHA